MSGNSSLLAETSPEKQQQFSPDSKDLEKQQQPRNDKHKDSELERVTTNAPTIESIPDARVDNGDSPGETQRDVSGAGIFLANVLDRAVSRISTKSSWNPGPPPDGGANAWTAGSHLQ